MEPLSPAKTVMWSQWADLNLPQGITHLQTDGLAPHANDLESIEFFVPRYMGGPAAISMIGQMKSLKVIQSPNAGVDDLLAVLPKGVTLCNAAGVHDDATSELAVLLTLSVLRDMPRSFKAQQNKHWETYFARSLADKTVLLIGYGNVGKAAEKRLLGFGCKVIPVARTARDHVHAISDLPNLIPSADVVMLIVPNNPGTVNLVDAKFLASMKDDSVLVNVARGVVVDTEALLAELRTGRIAAALDVTEPEPLPADHPLWAMPNVIITSHNGGEGDVFWERARTRIHSQFDLWLAGKPLECVITH